MGQARTNKGFLRNTVAWALLGLAAAGSAQAQTADPAQPTAESQPAAEDEEIVVTGSRIRTNEFNSPAPVQIITTESARAAGVANTAEFLQSSSLAAGSPQNDATISSAFVTEGGPGSQTISLRGLGANRTLVLVNGRRGGPAGVRGQVSAFDLNVLPLSIVDRVEILKDGASSVYGSDAIAGVVNIITRQDIDGFEANAFFSEPWEDGGAEKAFDVVYGHAFSRGHFNISYDYSLQEMTRQGERDWTDCAESYTFNATTGARNDAIDPRTGRPACRGNTLGGQVWLYDYSDEDVWGAPDPTRPWYNGLQTGAGILVQYDGTGQIGSFNPGYNFPSTVGFSPTAPPNWFLVNTNTGTAGAANYNNPFERNASIIPRNEVQTVFFEGAFDVTSNIELYSEVLLNRRQSAQDGARQIWTYLLSYDYGDPFSVGWNGGSVLSPTPVIDHFDSDQTVDYMRIVTGARGDFGGWLSTIDWDIYVQHSKSDAEYGQDVVLNDAVRSAQFRTASCAGDILPVSGRACVDVDWLRPSMYDNSGGTFSAEEQAFLYDHEVGTTTYEQTFVEGSLTTDIFSLPAGNAAAALGFVVRRDEIVDTPGQVTLAGNSWGLSAAGITEGDDETRELFGELSIPVLAGIPFAEDVTVTLSGRYTDVESYGTDSTYKLGLSWQITPEYKVRYSTGTSFRAPALYELYLADQTSFLGQRSIDPCINWQQNLDQELITQRLADNCAFSGGPNPVGGVPGDHDGSGSGATIITGGGLGVLEAETSESWVAGIVWTPSFIDLNVAVDYFDITIDNEVARLGAGGIVFGCYNSDQFPTDPLCSLFTRGQTTNPSLIDTVQDSYLNVNRQTNRGLDLTINYDHEFSFGDLNVEGQFTWQFEDTIALFEGTFEDQNGENGNPDYVGSVRVTFEQADWTYAYTLAMIGPASDREDIAETNSAGTTRYDITNEYTAYHAVSLRRDFDNFYIQGGIANISDEHPPTTTTIPAGGQSTIGPSNFASQYDYIGRRSFIRVGYNF
ncbi:MAG: TonB-dependent receptor [Terricaulis sp.]